MSGYYELSRLGVTFRPIDTWPGEPTRGRRQSTFSAKLSSTIALLARELRALDAKQVVVQIDVDDRMIRQDGYPRADARANGPGVIIAFQSKFGPLKYATDAFWDWKDNLRAIALSMEALRAVDRYGVSKRGEQYVGWRAIPASTGGGFASREQAEAFLAEHGGWLAAAKRFHPDNPETGDAQIFKRLAAARALAEGTT